MVLLEIFTIALATLAFIQCFTGLVIVLITFINNMLFENNPDTM